MSNWPSAPRPELVGIAKWTRRPCLPSMVTLVGPVACHAGSPTIAAARSAAVGPTGGVRTALADRQGVLEDLTDRIEPDGHAIRRLVSLWANDDPVGVGAPGGGNGDRDVARELAAHLVTAVETCLAVQQRVGRDGGVGGCERRGRRGRRRPADAAGPWKQVEAKDGDDEDRGGSDRQPGDVVHLGEPPRRPQGPALWGRVQAREHRFEDAVR